jgi:ribosomal protein L19E
VKTILNKTPLPMRIQLGGGKTLHLGPAKTGQIADGAAERASIRKLVKEGKIEILEEGGASQAQSGEGQQPAPSTHGHPQTTVVTPKGNR